MTTTETRHPRSKFSVDKMSEGDWLVRGTLDPLEALKFIVDVMNEHSEDGDLWGVSPAVYPDDPMFGLDAGKPKYGDLNPNAVQVMADWCHAMLQHARPGLYRKNPCGPGSYGRECENWAWTLGYADERGPGVFEGVYFQ